jgi:post-segregation antitoxin (ccd killing protein)
MRMARVNITVPDDVATRARQAGLNVSRIASVALADELDRLAKIAGLEAYLAELEAALGPPSADELADAADWADRILSAPKPKGRRSA